MSPDVIQFECAACRTQLTVPVQMAGVSGPCPTCGQTVTSPAAPMPAAVFAPAVSVPGHTPQPWEMPQAPPPPMMPPMAPPMMQGMPGMPPPQMGFPPAAPAMQAPPGYPPAMPGYGPPPMGGMPPMDPAQAAGGFGGGLPPRRAPGQSPMASPPLSPQAPGGFAPGGSLLGGAPLSPEMPPMGAIPSAAVSPTQSRLIPGNPNLPSVASQGAHGGMTGSLPANSLFARENPPAPVTPATQMLAPNPMTAPVAAGGMPSLNLGSALGEAPGGAPASPLPRGRSIAALRTPRGTNFIRLAIAAVFLLGFLGVAFFMLKDTIVGAFAAKDAEIDAQIPSITGSAKPTVPPASASGTEKSPNEGAPEPKGTELASNATSSNPAETTPLNDKPTMATAEPKIPIAQGQGLDSTPDQPELVAPPKAQPATQEEIKAATGGAEANGTMLTQSNGLEGNAPPLKAQLTSSTPDKSLPPAGGASGQALLEVATKTGTPPSQPMLSTQGTTLRDGGGPTSDDIPEKAAPALQALRDFLGARSVQERAKLTLGAEVMMPLMERYYSKMADGPITADHISFSNYEDRPELGSGAHCIFRIESKSWVYPVPVMMERQADGWKVDWLTFVELKDRKLEDFFKSYQEGRFMFHVGIYRQHYFDDAVPNRDQKDAFSIGLERPNPFRAPVFLPKDSPLAQTLRDRLPWETHVWAIVELEWKKLGSQQWVELVSMPQMHWYSVPATADKSDTPPTPKAHAISTSEQPQPAMPAATEKAPLIMRKPGTTPAPPAATSAGSEEFPPGIRRSAPTGSSGMGGSARGSTSPAGDEKFPPGIRRSPATGSR